MLFKMFGHQWPIVSTALGALLGTGLYFFWPQEPFVVTWLFFIATASTIAVCAPKARLLCLSTLVFIAWSQYTTVTTITDPIKEGTYWLNGRILNIEPTDKRYKVRLGEVTLYRANTTLKTVQFSVAKSRWPEGLGIGHGISAQVHLRPPNPPQFKEDYDGRMRTRLEGPEAYGYVRGSFEASYLAHNMSALNKLKSDAYYKLQHIRFTLSSHLSPHAGGLLSALIVGQRGFLSDSTWQAFRDSGLAHLLAISGMHIGFMAGSFFFLIRFLIVNMPRYGLLWPSKRIAAGVGFAVALIYMLLAGSTLPTIRAFTLLALLFGAVFLCRQRQLLRALSLAVLFILLLWPSSITTASFQLSFMAAFVLGLWFYVYEERERQRFPITGLLRYVHLVFLSSLVASLATLPLTVLHFSQASLGGILTNMFAIPLTAFWLMPHAAAILLTYPLGISAPFEWSMAFGANLLLNWAEWGATWPLSGVYLPSWSALPLAFLMIILLYTLLTEKYRPALISFAILLIALITLPLLAQKPDLHLLNNQNIALIKTQAGYSKIWPENLTRDQTYLLKRWEKQHNQKLIPNTTQLNCRHNVCTWHVQNQFVLFTPGYPTQEDCTLAHLIITPLKSKICPDKTLPPATAHTLNLPYTGKVKTFTPQRVRPWQQGLPNP